MGVEKEPLERIESSRTTAAPQPEEGVALAAAHTPIRHGLAAASEARPGAERNDVLLRTQQTYGNRYTQGVVEQLQRKSAGGKAVPSDRDIPDLESLPPGQPLGNPARSEMESVLGADFGAVRVHTDGDAALAANRLDAQAFTKGRDIYFASGMYNASTADGKRLLAHELVHTLQQPSMPALTGRHPVAAPGDPLEQEAIEISEAALGGQPRREPSPAPFMIARAPVSTSSASEAPKEGVTAQAYVLMHATEIVGYLGYDISMAEMEVSTPFVSWKGGSPRPFLIDLFAPYWARKNDLWNLLVSTLAPDSPERAVDNGRDIAPWKIGPTEWRGAVLGELYKLFTKRIHESLARLVPRWRGVKNQLELMVEGGDMSGAREPSNQEVFASHPLDPYVIGALPGKLDINYAEYRKAFPEAAIQKQLRSGLRPVTFDFQMAAGAWNWIRVTSPKDPTAEEVAKTLYGSETSAYKLTAAPPLFGYEDINELLHVHQQRYDKEGVKQKTDPSEVPPLYDETAANQILAGPLADEAALLAAPKVKAAAPAGASSRVLDRLRIIVRTLDRMVKEYSSLGGTLFPDETFQPTRDRVNQRSIRLATASATEIAAWDAQSAGQLDLVNAAESGLMMAKEQSKAFAAWPSAAGLARGIGHRYARVAESSDLVGAGRALLAEADEQSRLYPINLMDLLLAELRRALAAAHTDKTSMSAGRAHP
jgi:hypothetical protein